MAPMEDLKTLADQTGALLLDVSRSTATRLVVVLFSNFAPTPRNLDLIVVCA